MHGYKILHHKIIFLLTINRRTGSIYQIGTYLSSCFLVSSFACSRVLGPAEVVAPVPDVEEEEGEGEDDP